MNKILQKLAQIQTDKLLHSFYGTLIYALACFINPIVAIILTLVVAIAKEVYDEVKYKSFDFVDILATILIPMILFIKEF